MHIPPVYCIAKGFFKRNVDDRADMDVSIKRRSDDFLAGANDLFKAIFRQNVEE
jgi:hypothetical protein